MNKNIEVAIQVLERLKSETSAFQADALWKIGDFLADAVDREIVLEEEALFQQLREFHLGIAEMVAES